MSEARVRKRLRKIAGKKLLIKHTKELILFILIKNEFFFRRILLIAVIIGLIFF